MMSFLNFFSFVSSTAVAALLTSESTKHTHTIKTTLITSVSSFFLLATSFTTPFVLNSVAWLLSVVPSKALARRAASSAFANQVGWAPLPHLQQRASFLTANHGD